MSSQGRAGTFDRIRGSCPILQASAISTALMLTGRSLTLALASLACKNSSADPVWALISSKSSVKSTVGSRSQTCLLSSFRLSGSSRLPKGGFSACALDLKYQAEPLHFRHGERQPAFKRCQAGEPAILFRPVDLSGAAECDKP